MRKTSTDYNTPTRIDLTPMLDVVFILLIFFVVTATFVVERGIDTNPPEPGQQAAPPPDHIVIHITAADEFRLAGLYVGSSQLGPRLLRLHAQNPSATVIIDAHAFSSTAALVEVMDQARRVGIDNIRMAQN